MNRIQHIKIKLAALLLGAVLLALWYHWQIPCLFLLTTGIPCPGCGMTHAYLNVCRGDFAGAFEAHPFWWGVLLAVFLLLFDGQPFRQKWPNIALWILLAAGFSAAYVLRLMAVFGG